MNFSKADHLRKFRQQAHGCFAINFAEESYICTYEQPTYVSLRLPRTNKKL